MRVALYVIGGILTAIAAFIVIVVIFFKWEWVRAPLEARLSAASGKTVKLMGPIGGHIGWTSTLDLDDIHIENPKWKPDPTVGTIRHFHIALDVRAYLRGTLSIPEIIIDGPDLAMERRADGSSNWDIANEASGPSHRGDVPLIDKVTISDGKISYHDAVKKASIDMRFETVRAQGGAGGDHVDLEGKGTYQGGPFDIHITGGDLNQLRDLSKPYEIESFDAKLGPTHVTAKGRIGEPVKMSGLDIDFTIEGESAADLYRYIGVPAPETPPYKLTGRLDRDGKIWQFKDFKGKVGNSDLQGSLRFDTGQKPLFIGGNLVSEKLDLTDLGLIVAAPVKAKPGKVLSSREQQVAATYHQSPFILPDAPLREDEVRNVNTDLTFKGTKVEAQDLPLENVDFHLKIHDGVLDLDPLHVGVAGGVVAGKVGIDAHGEQVLTNYDLSLRQFDLSQFTSRAGHPEYAGGTIYGRIQLHGTGNTVHRSLGSSNGEVSLAVDRGHVSNLISHLLGLDIARAIGPLVTGKQEQVPLNCFVADFGVKNGVMTSKTFVIDTEGTTVLTSGTIDLSHEALDLTIKGGPKKMSPLALDGPILVGGTFKDPHFGLGARAIARGGAAVALGVLATPLASILAFIDPGTPPEVNCQVPSQLKGSTHG